MSLARSLRRKARAALTTYSGRHWPDARSLGHDGIAVHLSESNEAEKKLWSYVAALDPELIIATLDELEALRATPVSAGLDVPEDVFAWWREKRYSVTDLQRAFAQGPAARLRRLEAAAREYLAHDGSGNQRNTPPEWGGDFDAIRLHDALDALRTALSTPEPGPE